MNPQQQPIRRCGKCEKDITGIEPAQCSFCEAFFHVQQECCDASRSSIQQFFSCRKALWLCLNCRKLFANRTLHSFLEERDTQKDVDPIADVIRNLQSTVQELTQKVSALQKQVDENHAAVIAKIETAPPVKWPSKPTAVASTSSNAGRPRGRSNRATKRRCGPDGEPVEVEITRPPIPSGTGEIDLSDLQLSCPVAATTLAPKFWVYLSGFNPIIKDDDVKKIVKRCLDVDDAEIYRLVPKNADTSRYTYVSFKVGMDPSLEEKALQLSTWPQSIRVREFKNTPKNDQQIDDEAEMETDQ